eukprot:7810761-Lingulodinium_polyedra.AAC.1
MFAIVVASNISQRALHALTAAWWSARAAREFAKRVAAAMEYVPERIAEQLSSKSCLEMRSEMHSTVTAPRIS